MGQLIPAVADAPPPVTVPTTTEKTRPPFETSNLVNNVPTQLDGPSVSDRGSAWISYKQILITG